PNKLVDETLSGFPLLVTVVDPSLAAHVTSSADFRFTLGGSTTVLAHEIVSWNSENGALVAWVRLPALSALFDTKILMYYGNPSPPSPAPSIPVWTDGFPRYGIWTKKMPRHRMSIRLPIVFTEPKLVIMPLREKWDARSVSTGKISTSRS
ncbi:MAG TPA: DUF2341 domain-containing protein, partial [Polyangiaceae bacterium]|nr:DUF2341 domain-containing protein [Polyangiaceae bacterium]